MAVKAFGKIDGIVINHGVLEPVSRLENFNVEEWKRAYDINVFSGLALVRKTFCSQLDYYLTTQKGTSRSA